MGNRMKSYDHSTPYLLFVVVVGAFSGFLYGYHTGVISGALAFLASSFHLNIADQAMVVSIILFGALLGALFAGSLADRMGRKRTIALTSALLVIGSVLISMSVSYEILLLGRFITGIGVGILSLSAPLYLAEISPEQLRGSYVSLYQLAIAIGILASYAVGYFFSDTGDWRWMFAFGIFPALLQGVALFFLPETPPWLFNRSMEKKAIGVLQKTRKGKQWMKHLDEMKSSAAPHKSGKWKALLSHKLRFVLFIGFILSAMQQITGINTVIFYAPKIFETAGFQSATGAIVATLGVGIVNVLATALSVWLLDRVGRRILLLIGTGGMTVFLSLLAIAFFSKSELIDQIAVVSLMAYVAFFAIGLGPVTWVMLSEIYPLKVRGKAMSIAIFINWSCNYLVSLTFLEFIELLGAFGTFLMYALISALSFWFMYRYIVETRGKSLEEIESLVTRY
jgi:SP family galactose:H+ symporter-like MFS transporter